SASAAGWSRCRKAAETRRGIRPRRRETGLHCAAHTQRTRPAGVPIELDPVRQGGCPPRQSGGVSSWGCRLLQAAIRYGPPRGHGARFVRRRVTGLSTCCRVGLQRARWLITDQPRGLTAVRVAEKRSSRVPKGGSSAQRPVDGTKVLPVLEVSTPARKPRRRPTTRAGVKRARRVHLREMTGLDCPAAWRLHDRAQRDES